MTKQDRIIHALFIICAIMALIVIFLNREIVFSQEAPLQPHTEILNVVISDSTIAIEYEIYGWVRNGDAILVKKTGQNIDTYAARNDTIYLKESRSAKYVPAQEEKWIMGE